MAEENSNTSNISNNPTPNINKLIEEGIEKKINQLLDILPSGKDVDIPKKVQDFTIGELYNGTLQTLIDVLNDLSSVMSERKYMSAQKYRESIIAIFTNKKRKLFIGIVLVLLSFILYFIDGSDA